MLNPDFSDMLSAFTGESVEYLVVGAYALAAHGVPRATGDLDFWIRPSADNAARGLRALALFGAPTGDLTTEDLTTPDLVFRCRTQSDRHSHVHRRRELRRGPRDCGHRPNRHPQRARARPGCADPVLADVAQLESAAREAR